LPSFFKSQKRSTESMLGGLRAIAELPNLVRRILIYGGANKLKSADGIEVWTVEALLRALESDRLWP